MDATALLAILTALSNIGVIIILGLWFVTKVIKNKFWSIIEKYTLRHSLKIIVIVSLISTLGSLYFSEVRGFSPCRLCWYQRIFMYPQIVISIVALLKKLKDIYFYTLVLSLIGGIIAIYNYFLQINPNPFTPCEVVGYSVSCNERFFTYYGYITIPWMSFSAFIIIFFLSYLNIKVRKTK